MPDNLGSIGLSAEAIKGALLDEKTPSREVLQSLSDLAKAEPDVAAPLVAIVADRVFHPITRV